MNARLRSKQIDAQMIKLTATERARIERGEFMIADINWKLCRECRGSGETESGSECKHCKGKGETLLTKKEMLENE